MDFKYPIAWMNGTPRNCQGCGRFLPCKGSYVEAWQNNLTGKLYCSEDCEGLEETKLLTAARMQ